jgi:hypothetical protein
MKKLFTLLVAMVMVTMSFAQVSPKPVYALDEPVSLDQKSDWFGYTSSEYFTQYEEGDVYFVTFPAAGTLPTNATIDKVCFGWQESGTVSGQQVNFDPNFKIVIYVGGNTDWLDTNPLISANTGWYTEDMSNMGTLVYEQNVDASVASSRGIVQVDLTTPFQISSAGGQQIWVGIECMGNTCGYIGNLDNPDYNYDWRINLQKYSTSNSSTGYRIAPFLYYADDAHTSLFAGKPSLGVYVNDGVAYQPQSDWVSEIYDPEDEAMYPEGITWLTLDEYADTLYFYGGAFNMGMDPSYGMYYLSLYAQVEGGDPVNLGLDEDPIFENDSTYEQYYGMRYGPVAIMGVDEFAEYGLSYPFQVCFDVRYVSAASYNGVDPDLTNNHYCITVSDQDGVAENTNTLTVSPNPASTEITIENAAGSQIFVYNIAGQEVMSVESAKANETLNVSKLNAGLYIVRVVNGNEVSTAKVSIVR